MSVKIFGVQDFESEQRNKVIRVSSHVTDLFFWLLTNVSQKSRQLSNLSILTFRLKRKLV